MRKRINLDRYRRGGQLILSKKQIYEIAEDVLLDFKSEALKIPLRVNADEFVELYLGYTLRYEHLSHNQSILGSIVFNNGKLKVYDAENNKIKDILVNEKTILIDKSLLNKENEGRYEFTLMHEGGHSILHMPEKLDKGQISMFDNETVKPAMIICRSANQVDTLDRKSPEYWREKQADIFSAYMKMPSKTTKEVAIQYLRDIGVFSDRIRPMDEDFEALCSDILPSVVAEFFGTSKQAARIRLQELGIIILLEKDFFDK